MPRLRPHLPLTASCSSLWGRLVLRKAPRSSGTLDVLVWYAFSSMEASRLPTGSAVYGICCRDDAEAAQLDAVGFAPQTTKTSVVKCRPVRITLGGFQSQFSGEAYQEQLYVRLRPLTWQGQLIGTWAALAEHKLGVGADFDGCVFGHFYYCHTASQGSHHMMMCAVAGRDAAYTPVDRAGNALVGTELEMSSEQMQEDILVEVCNDAQEVIAQTTVRVEDLWQVISAWAVRLDSLTWALLVECRVMCCVATAHMYTCIIGCRWQARSTVWTM